MLKLPRSHVLASLEAPGTAEMGLTVQGSSDVGLRAYDCRIIVGARLAFTVWEGLVLGLGVWD